MPVAAPVFNPFPGLRPFCTDEDYLFFGREGQSEELLKRLRLHRFLAVIGSSGSGKSSLVKAGLLPYLFGGFMAQAGSHWRVAVFRPGNDPIGNLAAALNDPAVLGAPGSESKEEKKRAILLQVALRRSTLGLIDAVREADLPPRDNLLIVVDQFEELFRFTKAVDSVQADEDAAAFVNLLLEAGKQTDLPIYIAITMRSDFIGDCARYRDLPEAVTAGLYLIPRMTREQRRAAIESPIKVGGATISRQLVNRVLNDGGEDPNQLPKLQHALMRTWSYWEQNHRGDEPVDIEDYNRAGGLAGALSQHADEAYDELPDDRHRLIAKRMFQALTERGSENREIRRPTRVAKIAAIAGVDEASVIEVAEYFRREGRSFLTPSPDIPLDGNSVIDISHESLIGGWKRLKEWVEEEAESAKTYRRLGETAALNEQKKADLWDGPELLNAWTWREREKPTAAWGETYYPGFDRAMAFLEASKRAQDDARIADERRRSQELRRAHIFTGALSALFVIAALLAIWAIGQTRVARRAREDAEAKFVQAQHSEENAKRQEAAARNAEEAAKQSAKNAHDAEAEAHNAEMGQALQAREARAALENARTQKDRADQNSNTSVKFAGSAIRSWQSLSDTTTAAQELQHYYERLLQGAQDVHKTIMSNTPDNMEVMEFYITDVVSLPDLHLRQGHTDEAKAECAENESTAQQWAQDKSLLKRTLAALLLSYSAKTQMRIGDPVTAVTDAADAVKMADDLAAGPRKIDDRGWDDLSVAYGNAGEVQEQYAGREYALHDYQQAAAAYTHVQNRSAELTDSHITFLRRAAGLQAALDRQADSLATYNTAVKEGIAWISAIGADASKVSSSENEQARLDVATLYVEEGDALANWKLTAKAEDAYKQCRLLLEKLDSKNKTVAFELSLSDERLGNVWNARAADEKEPEKKKEDYQLALKFHQSAWQERKQIENVDQNMTSEFNLGIAETNIGVDYFSLGEFQQALDHYKNRLSAYQLSAQLSPQKETTTRIRAAARDVADLYARLNQPAEALKAYLAAVDADHALPDLDAATVADDLQKVVELETSSAQTDAALATYKELIERLDKIAARTKTPESIDRLFWARIGHGDLLSQSKKYTDAQNDYDGATKEADRIDRQTYLGHFDRGALNERFGNLYFNEVADQKDQESRDKCLHVAGRYYTKALEEFRAISDKNAAVARAIASEQDNLARDFRYLKLKDQAREQYRLSIESFRNTAKTFPSPEAQQNTARVLSDYATFEDEAQNFSVGKAACTDEIAILTPLANQAAASAENKTSLSAAYGTRAWFEIFLGEFDDAIRDADAGLKIDGNLAGILVNKAHALLFAGHWNDALRIYRENVDKPIDLTNPASEKFGAAALADFEDFRKRATPKMNLALLKRVEPDLRQAMAASSTQQLATARNQVSAKH